MLRNASVPLLFALACGRPEPVGAARAPTAPAPVALAVDPAGPSVSVQLPPTPGGALARGLLDAVHADDPKALDAFMAGRLSERGRKAGSLDEWAQYFRGLGGASGGVDVVRVEPQFAGSNDVVFHVRARDADRYARVSLAVDERGDLVDGFILPTLDPTKPDEGRLPEVVMSEAALVRAISGRAAQLAAADRFSGVVLVARGDRVLVHVAHGRAEQAFAAENRLDTRFNLGSMNKMFTAVAVAQLVEQGKLAFETTVAEVLPDYPDPGFAASATVHHLLTHTSGIGGTIFAPAMYEHRERYKTPADYIPLFAAVAPDFPPGTRFAYANPGFIVLGRIVERVSGEPYDAYVERHIFAVAGMRDTRAHAWDELTPNLAVGYMRDPNDVFGLLPRRTNVSTLPYSGTPAGGGYSTALDLLAFVRALRGHRLLGPATLATVLAGKVDAPPLGGESKYGYGMIVRALHGKQLRGHHGGAPGINGHLEFFADGDGVVVVLGNHDFPNATALAEEIVALLAAQPT